MPSNYYKYEFVSPESLYALVKEELKSYFDTGAVDDTLFTKWTEKCLKKLGRGSYKINQTLLNLENSQARLPDGFVSVREAWGCTCINNFVQNASADYNQIITTRLDTPDVYCNLCTECKTPDIIQAIYKTTNQILFEFKRNYLLKPGNVSVRKDCGLDCANMGIECKDSFDIRDNKFVVNFREGVVHLVYYSEELTEEGYQLIPDNVRIQEYIESYIKYKTFEMLSNEVVDDTSKMIEGKRDRYEAEQYMKQCLAEIEMKKQTVWQKHQATQRQQRRLNKFQID